MIYLKSLILGLIQGLTEFVPVSSSGHLVLLRHFLGFEGMADLSFEAFVHLGSLVAVFIHFRKELFDLLKSVIYFNNPDFLSDRKICFWLFSATLVTGGIGLLSKNMIESFFTEPMFVAFMIALTGFILFISDRIRCGNLKSSELNFKKSVFIGIGQALAITPGISRSGTTITFTLLCGLERKSATMFAFLLSIPAILGSNLLEFRNLVKLENAMLLSYLIGFLAAFISGYVVIGWLIKLIATSKLYYFSYYCWGLAALCIVFLL